MLTESVVLTDGQMTSPTIYASGISISIETADTEGPSIGISIGIELGLLAVSVSVPVSIGAFPESRYQSRYRLGALLSPGISPGIDSEAAKVSVSVSVPKFWSLLQMQIRSAKMAVFYHLSSLFSSWQKRL